MERNCNLKLVCSQGNFNYTNRDILCRDLKDLSPERYVVYDLDNHDEIVAQGGAE